MKWFLYRIYNFIINLICGVLLAAIVVTIMFAMFLILIMVIILLPFVLLLDTLDGKSNQWILTVKDGIKKI